MKRLFRTIATRHQPVTSSQVLPDNKETQKASSHDFDDDDDDAEVWTSHTLVDPSIFHNKSKLIDFLKSVEKDKKSG
jgi:hypothetical protein